MRHHAFHGTWIVACLMLLSGCAAETTETQRPVIDDDTPPTNVQQRHTGVDEPQTGIGDEGAIDTTQPDNDSTLGDPQGTTPPPNDVPANQPQFDQPQFDQPQLEDPQLEDPMPLDDPATDATTPQEEPETGGDGEPPTPSETEAVDEVE